MDMTPGEPGNEKDRLCNENMTSLYNVKDTGKPVHEKGRLCNSSNTNGFLADQAAFSSTIDALFFLIMISIVAVLLMPSIMADNQYEAAGYTVTQEFDTHLLESLLGSSADEFEYKIAPLAVVNISIPSNTITQDPIKTLFTKEQKHRTFVDLVAESMILNLMMDNNGSGVYLNPITKEHPNATCDMIRSYLDSTIEGRYNYRFESHWYPVSGFPLGSDIIIGDAFPSDSIRQNAKLTLPFTDVALKHDIFEEVNDSVLSDALESSSNETMRIKLHDGFNNSIDVAARGSAGMIVRSTFPSAYLLSLNKTIPDTQNNQSGIISVPEGADILDPDLVVAACLLNYTANTVAGMDMEIPGDRILSGLVSLVEEGLVSAIQEQVAFQLKADMSGEINRTVYDIINGGDFDNAKVLRDIQVQSICKRVNYGDVDIELILWQ
ncbi:MAG TPA: hypothetical protein C5S50_03330 [Methanosarcinaceae archaeon]|nr:hypothetical protein [Methanosarcinaceae archaeon]